MKIVKKLICAVLSCVIILCLGSCGSDKFDEQYIYYATPSKFSSFDPQLVETAVELSVAANCFEGLMTKDENGNTVNGSIESYQVSDDKKTYTFKLKDGLLWSDGETPLTAKDFVCGFRRAVLPATNSPYVSLLYNIKNAKKIRNNGVSSKKLGVQSADDKTIIIKLNSADDDFIDILTKPITYPCNEEFFKSTNGKYGLNSDNIITNGSYFVSTYDLNNNQIKISKNSNYKGAVEAVPAGMTFNFSTEYDDIYKLFDDGEIDLGDAECDYLRTLESNGNANALFYTTNYLLYISNDLKTESGINLKNALRYDIDLSSINANLTDYYIKAKGIIPESNLFDNVNYRESVSEFKFASYNKKAAEKALGDYEQAADVLKGIAIYYPENFERLELISNLIAQTWQKDINAYINTKPESEDAILEGVKSGDINIAIIPVSSENNSAVSTFNCLDELKIADSADGFSLKQLFKAEKAVIKSGNVLPIVSIPKAVSCSSEMTNINYSTDGKTIDLRFTKKK